MKPLITVIGDTTLDLVSEPLQRLPREDTEIPTKFFPKLGGQAAHCALGLAKLGVPTKFITCIGKGPYCNDIIKKLATQKNLRLMHQKRSTMALSMIVTTRNKRTIFCDNGANAFLTNINPKSINTLFLFLGGLWNLERLNSLQLLKDAKRNKKIIFMDVGYTPNPDRKKLFQALKHVDYFFADKKELLHYTNKKTLKEAFKSIPKTCALGIHLGKEGSAFYKNGYFVKVPIKEMYNEDTTGAGDYWNSGFIYGIIKKWKPEKILSFANQFTIKCLNREIHHL